MLQIGRIATEIDLRSLLSGPVNVRSLELRDVTVFLERNRKGGNNWTFGEPGAEESADDETGSGFTKLPVAFQLRRFRTSKSPTTCRRTGSRRHR
jgi:uncharacterized protein involved in outer membrane biogenesis